MYLNGLRAFPDSVSLKIDYSWFLLSKMMNRREALKELLNAEKQRPTFEEGCVIFRYRQLIEEEVSDSVGEGGASVGMDYVAALNFENLFRSLRSSIERSSILHYDFWNMLLDDSPDL